MEIRGIGNNAFGHELKIIKAAGRRLKQSGRNLVERLQTETGTAVLHRPRES
jgi:hypothetical protein